ncbi:DEAD/DEAH box helicase [Candidatus Pacearchaeota archaeon]|nr:DEAD/DEAH box helicase [Candidatus Pacearchaeota archaeon]
MEKFVKLLGEDNPLLQSLKRRGFDTPTEIQEKSIPDIMQGHDVIAGASTGSGKTLAFAAGLIKNTKKEYGIQGLILTPTRELAEQISDELKDFSKPKNLDVISVYGGVSIGNQIKRLEYADIVVGTPGRILDHIGRNSIDLSHVNTLVLDEADRMLDMGFREDVGKIIMNCPGKRQTMLFSATISPDITDLSSRYMKDPVEISATEYVDPTKLSQVFYDVEDNLKYSLLKHLVENEKSKLVMIFCNTRRNVDFVANNLKFMGIEAVPMHGGFTQDKRTKILKSFHSEKVHVLVATDVAARGLDIKEVTHIYNYDIPDNVKDYTHRIGRTARAGKEGNVINILASRDYDNFRNLMKNDDFKIKRLETPYIKRARIRWMAEKRNDRNKRRNSQDHQRRNPRDRHHSSSHSRNSSYNKRPRR